MLTAYIFHLKVLHKPDYIKRKKVFFYSMILITFVWLLKKRRNSNEESGSFDGCGYECREWD